MATFWRNGVIIAILCLLTAWLKPALAAGVVINDFWLDSDNGGGNHQTQHLYITSSGHVDFLLDQWSYADCLFVYSPELDCHGCNDCGHSQDGCTECNRLKYELLADLEHMLPGKPSIDSITPQCDQRGGGLLVHFRDSEEVNRFGISTYTVEDDEVSVAVVRIPEAEVSNDNYYGNNLQIGLGGETKFWRIPLHYIEAQSAIDYISAFAEYTPELYGSTMVFPDGTLVEVPELEENSISTLPKLSPAQLVDRAALCVWYLTNYMQISRIEAGRLTEIKDFSYATLRLALEAEGCVAFKDALPAFTERDALTPYATRGWLLRNSTELIGFRRHFFEIVQKAKPNDKVAQNTLAQQWFNAQFSGTYGFELDALLDYAGRPELPAGYKQASKLLDDPPAARRFLAQNDTVGLIKDLRAFADKLPQTKKPLERVEDAFKLFFPNASLADLEKAATKAPAISPPVDVESNLPYNGDNTLEQPFKWSGGWNFGNAFVAPLDGNKTSAVGKPESMAPSSQDGGETEGKTRPQALIRKPVRAGLKEGVTLDISTQSGEASTDELGPLNVAPKDVIIFQGNEAGAKKLEQMLAVMDFAPRRIKLRVHICEIREDGLDELGFDLGPNNVRDQYVEQGSEKDIFEPFSLGDFYRARGLTFEAVLGTLIKDGRAKILAEPTLTTVENYPAQFAAVRKVPFTSGIRADANSDIIIEEIDYREIGIKLDFLPRLGHGDSLTIDVRPVISSLLDQTAEGGNSVDATGALQAPEYFERSVKSIVSVRNGEPFAIAGMIDERMQFDVDKIPILSEIPLLGKLFQKKRSVKDRSEVCIIVIPEIMEDIAASGYYVQE
jgi:hypothetical protein